MPQKAQSVEAGAAQESGSGGRAAPGGPWQSARQVVDVREEAAGVGDGGVELLPPERGEARAAEVEARRDEADVALLEGVVDHLLGLGGGLRGGAD